MRCDEAQELISARVDNEIDGDARLAVDDHLKSCSNCSRAFAQESLLKRRIQLTGRRIGAPSGLRRAIEEAKSAPAAATPRTARPAAAWAAIKSIATKIQRRKIVTEDSLPASRGAVEEGKSVSAASKSAAPVVARPALRAIVAKLSWRAVFNEASRPAWRWAFAAAIVLVAVSSVIYTERRPEKQHSIALAALDSHAAIVSGKTTLLRAVNLPAMRKELAQAVGGRFKPMVLDLSLVRLQPIAGFVQNVAGRDLLVTVYQGDGTPITCFTFLGSEADAPEGAEKFFDADRGVNYYSFSRGEWNGVLHQEGEVICLLVSTMSPAELLALARGRSAHA
jgi:hypothetical protein